MAYDVLARIIDGLGVPRGLAGLAYVEPGAQSAPWGGFQCEDYLPEEDRPRVIRLVRDSDRPDRRPATSRRRTRARKPGDPPETA